MTLDVWVKDHKITLFMRSQAINIIYQTENTIIPRSAVIYKKNV